MGSDRIDVVAEEHGASQEKPQAPTVDERKLVRKIDLHLVPLVMGLYLFSFIDRVNIGNARLYHFESDLNLSSTQFQTAISIFYVTYILCEVPSNLVLKYFTPRLWISFLAFSWGIVATLSGLINSYGALIACRLLMGVLEAGLFPGLAVYLTFFYTKHELARRVGYLFVSAAIGGGLGGLLAFGIGHMDGVRGMSGWRWIFIVEGLPSVLLGIATYLWLPNDAQTAYFLTDEEKVVMKVREGRDYGNTASSKEFSKADMMKAFTDWKVWAFCIGQFGSDTMLYGYSTFLPTIINDLGTWTTSQVQLLTIPCYFLGAAMYMGVATASDRFQRRGVFCIIFGLLSIVGYVILLTDAPTAAHYVACFLVASGVYILVGLPLAWLPNNSPRYGKRTTATGMQLTIGNSAGILSSFIYPKGDAPRYTRGHALTLALVGMSTCIFAFLWFWYARENRRRREADTLAGEHAGLSEEQLQELGDESPRFVYTI